MKLASISQLILCAFLVLLTTGCGFGSPSVSQVPPTEGPRIIVQSESQREELQSIEIDNCNGKSEIKRTEQRSQSIEVSISAEVAAQVGVNAQVVQAEVQATVGAQMGKVIGRSTSIELNARPNTRLIVQLAWTGQEQIGIVQNLKSAEIPIAFRTFSPTDVRIKNQSEIDCNGSQSGTSLPVVTVPAQPVQTPVIVAATQRPPTTSPTRTRTEMTCPLQITRAEVESWHAGETDVPTVASYVRRFDSKNVNNVGMYSMGSLLPAGVLIATNLDETDGTRWREFPVIPIVHSGTYGLFETTAEFTAPNTGACLRIVP